MISQRELGLDTNSYADALRHVVRQDPDVILLGEMRDLETMSAALTAAQTGHLVLSTAHTIGAIQTVNRIVDFFPPHQQNQIRAQLASLGAPIVGDKKYGSRIELKNNQIALHHVELHFEHPVHGSIITIQSLPPDLPPPIS